MLTHDIQLLQESFTLHPYGAMYWRSKGWLLLSDLHLGKSAHFRKAGIPLPEGADTRTLERLDNVIAHFRPVRVVVIGDLFHSSVNASWERFAHWVGTTPAPMHLVPGNHDILADRRYAEAGIHVCDERLEEGPFVLMHDAQERRGCYVIGGHMHPGVALTGKGRQHLRLPCFWFGARRGLLPAFGTGTGLHIVAPGTRDRVLACTDRAVIDVSRTNTPAFSG